jgi:putative spermidine/putrescine transport system ATP-binding protein
MLPAGIALPQEGEQVTLTFNRENLHLMEEGA